MVQHSMLSEECPVRAVYRTFLGISVIALIALTPGCFGGMQGDSGVPPNSPERNTAGRENSIFCDAWLGSLASTILCAGLLKCANRSSLR